MADPLRTLNRIKEEEVQAFLDEHENDLRPWHRKEWKERSEELKQSVDTCEWCGEESPDQLHPHHTTDTPQWGRLWINAADASFAKSDAFGSRLADGREECPECGLRDYYARKTKEPTYRCNNCKREFDSPEVVKPSAVVAANRYDTKPYLNNGYYEAKGNWVDDNREAVQEEFRRRFEERMEEYLTTDEIVVICGSCHFQEEQTSNKRCSRCGSWFKPGSKDMCWDCIVEEKGLEQCGECGDGWYQPSKYGACADCR